MENTQNTTENTQLSFDFYAQNQVRSNPLDTALQRAKISFHKEASVIMADRFSLKLTHQGRSYLIRGTYRIEMTKSYTDFSFTKEVVHVSVSNFYSYRNDGYVPCYLMKKEAARLEKVVGEILSSPYYNQNLAIAE